jgi:hypothetical protein
MPTPMYAMTGLRAFILPRDARLVAKTRVLEHARTFSDQLPGMVFWYENSNGLVEIAVNQGRADHELSLMIGSPIETVFLNDRRILTVLVYGDADTVKAP